MERPDLKASASAAGPPRLGLGGSEAWRFGGPDDLRVRVRLGMLLEGLGVLLGGLGGILGDLGMLFGHFGSVLGLQFAILGAFRLLLGRSRG